MKDIVAVSVKTMFVFMQTWNLGSFLFGWLVIQNSNGLSDEFKTDVGGTCFSLNGSFESLKMNFD